MLDIRAQLLKLKKMIMENLQMLCSGRIILIEDKDLTMSTLLFGKMYLNESRNEIISQLSQVFNEKHYKAFVSKLCRRGYGFKKPEKKFTKLQFTDVTHNEVIDFTRLDYEGSFYADWLFFKNITNKAIQMVFLDEYELFLEPNESIACRAGQAVPYPQSKVIKTKDTIHPIILIEKI